MILAPTLTLSAGSGAAIARPTFSRDFAGEKTLNNGTGPAITFTRASNATFFDASGVLQTASNNEPRFDHDPATGASRGLLIEEARTNSIRNSQAGGSTNGVIGSGGVMPTNWGISSVLTATGLSREVIGTGTSNGFAYIDVKISGTNTSGSAVNIGFGFESGLQIAALSGQTWTSSAYVALVGGSFSGAASLAVSVVERNSGGIFLNQSVVSILSATSTLTRFAVTRTLSEATTAFVNPAIVGSVNNGSTVDFTLRIAAPQLEQGAFPTSYIPTTTAEATRSADSAVVAPISGFYNQSEGTLFAEGSARGGSLPSLASLDDNTANERIQLRRNISVSQAQFLVSDGGTAVVNVNTGSWTSDTAAQKLILAYKADDCAASFNGASVVADTSASMPQATQFLIGNGANSNLINGHLRKIAYWPKRLSNALLEQLTT